MLVEILESAHEDLMDGYWFYESLRGQALDSLGNRWVLGREGEGFATLHEAHIL